MAQESSWKEEAEAPVMCANNCGFFGSAMTNNMCSKCYRDHVLATSVSPAVQKKAAAAAKAAPSAAAEPVSTQSPDAAGAAEQPQPQAPASRCLSCRKKVGLLGFRCRCGGTFCSSHRYADAHKCGFDYKEAGREELEKKNPVVVASKITKI